MKIIIIIIITIILTDVNLFIFYTQFSIVMTQVHNFSKSFGQIAIVKLQITCSQEKISKEP